MTIENSPSPMKPPKVQTGLRNLLLGSSRTQQRQRWVNFAFAIAFIVIVILIIINESRRCLHGSIMRSIICIRMVMAVLVVVTAVAMSTTMIIVGNRLGNKIVIHRHDRLLF